MRYLFTTPLMALLLAGVGCVDADVASEQLEITAEECEAIDAPFSEPGCPNPANMTDNAVKTKCEGVKTVAFSNYPPGKDCSGGVVLGPGPVIKACTGDDDDRCRLNAPTTGAKWPGGGAYSECLNDWFVHCGNEKPETLGIGEDNEMCFADFDISRPGPDSATGRELCQNMDESGSFPDACDDPCEDDES